MITPESFLSFTIDAVMFILLLSILLVLLRLLRGPSLPDRVIALDMLATIAVGMIMVDAISTEQVYFLRAGIVLALVAFLGTVSFAFYMLKGSNDD